MSRASGLGFFNVRTLFFFFFAAKKGLSAFLLTMEQRQLHTYIHLTILTAFSTSSPDTEGVWSWLMTHYSILLTVHTPWMYCRKLCSRKRYMGPHIFSRAEIFPTHFLIPLTDCWTHQKLSWNLITPLTFMFQPQFFFRRTILAPEAAWQERIEQCKCSRRGN